MSNILIVSEKKNFLMLSMAEHLRKLSHAVMMVSLDVDEIAGCKEKYEAILIDVEQDGADISRELVFLRDKAVEEDIPIFCMEDDRDILADTIPNHLIQEVFKRPVDVNLVSQKIDKFVQNYGSHTKKKILVVDDSGAMLRNVKGWLEDRYQVILANSGAMAIKYLATNRPDLVLLDYEMPVIDGKQVFEMIRSESEFSDIPVIFLTSKNDKESIMSVVALKPAGYLLKSMEPAKIVQEVDDFFARQKRL